MNWPKRPYIPSGETYLALYAVDIGEPRCILHLANEYAHLDGGEMIARYEDANMILRAEPYVAALERERSALTHTPPSSTGFELLEEFRFAARVLRDLTSAWRVVSGQIEPDQIRWVWTPAPSHGEARALLRGFLSPLLRDLHPRLEVVDTVPEDQWAAPIIATHPVKRSTSLFEACAAELYNHIVAQTVYKLCANETCGRLFVLQRGRAAHGQHRTTGVKYCSSNCARAQNQRKYRRRQREHAQDDAS
jgi:hypothetical protein